MPFIVIPQKQSNSGTISDIASEHGSRVIAMGKSFEFAVLLPDYYNAGETRHKTIEAAEKVCRAHYRDDYRGIKVIDRRGNEWDFDGYELRQLDAHPGYQVVDRLEDVVT